MGFPCGSAGKESACNERDLGSIPGLGRSPGEEKGYPLQYSGLDNSMDCSVHGVMKSQTQLSNFHSHRALHPKSADHTFFSSAHGTFSRIDHMLGHKASLGKCKEIKIISNIFSDLNAIRLEINYKNKTLRNTNTWWLNNMLLNN